MSHLLKAMTYGYPEEIPVSVGILPAMWMYYGKEMEKLAKEYPEYIPAVPDRDAIAASLQPSYRQGCYIDEWNCVWENHNEGMEAIVTGHPVPNRAALLDAARKYKTYKG